MTARPEKISSARWEWLAAGLITLAILWLHYYFWQHAGGLWRDEVNTVHLAQSHSLTAMSHDSFPILLPGLLAGWNALGWGDTDAGLRFAGLLFGCAIPVAFWVMAWSTGRPPLFSLGLFGLNALFIAYSDSLRAYGLGSALIVLTLAAMWSLLKVPTWPRAALLALVATVSVQALFQNAVLFFALCLGGFAVCLRRKDRATAGKLLSAGMIAAASLLPYYANFAGLPQAAVELRHGFSPLITSINFGAATGFPCEPYTAAWEILAVAVIGLAIRSGRGECRAEKNAEASLPLFAGVTLVAVLVSFIAFLWFAAVSAPPWYFIPPLALVVACLDGGLAGPALPRLLRLALLGFLLVTALVSVPVARQKLNVQFTNVDRLAAQVAAESAPADFIVVTPWFDGLTFARYYAGATPWQTLPPLTDHQTHRYNLILKAMSDPRSLAPVLGKISDTLRSGHRIWVVGTLPNLRTNAFEPPILPPPPLPGSGWSDTPYSQSWAARTEFFLRQHSVRFDSRPDATNATVNLQENLRLFTAEGWRD